MAFSQEFSTDTDVTELSAREQRLVYLVTYSRADLEKIPSRESFAKAVTEGWKKTSGTELLQYVVSRELHANVTDGESTSDCHYHMAPK